MVGLMQIMIYLLCIYLVYKGIEIFQIAFCANPDTRSRPVALGIGILAVIASVGIALIFFFMTEGMAKSIGDNFNKLPR